MPTQPSQINAAVVLGENAINISGTNAVYLGQNAINIVGPVIHQPSRPSVDFVGFSTVEANFGILYKMRFRITQADPGECRCDIRVGEQTFSAKWDETPNPVRNDHPTQFAAEMVPATRLCRLYMDCDYQIPILIRSGGATTVFDGWWFGRHLHYGSHPTLDDATVVSITLRG